MTIKTDAFAFLRDNEGKELTIDEVADGAEMSHSQANGALNSLARTNPHVKRGSARGLFVFRNHDDDAGGQPAVAVKKLPKKFVVHVIREEGDRALVQAGDGGELFVLTRHALS